MPANKGYVMNTILQILPKHLLVMCVLAAANLSFGFAANGHHLVALVSMHNLTTTTQLAIEDLLGSASLAEVSTWADAEREHNRSTSTWHYIDYNIATGNVEREHANQATILDAISSNSAALQFSKSRETRQRALKFIVHFVGDLHQPLHCADNNDAGGNKTLVIFQGEQTRLHRLWDGPVVDHMLAERYPGKKLEEVALSFYEKYKKRQNNIISGTPESWARESFAIARDHVYRLQAPPVAGHPHPIDESYLKKSTEIIEGQLAKAGLRLAHLLNLLLDPGNATVVQQASQPNRESHTAKEAVSPRPNPAEQSRIVEPVSSR